MLFTIRNGFDHEELPALYEIEKDCFEKDFRYPESVFRSEMNAAWKKKLVWVAYIGNRIAGFLIAANLGGKINIETCNVSRLYRRKGVGSRLITACERTVKQQGYNHTTLEVYTENPAQILYFGLGYRVCGFKRNFYAMRKHGISMMKEL